MKRILTITLILASLATAYMIGQTNGRNHVIHDSTLFVVDLPDRNQYGGFDDDEITVYLEIDDECHEFGAWIG